MSSTYVSIPENIDAEGQADLMLEVEFWLDRMRARKVEVEGDVIRFSPIICTKWHSDYFYYRISTLPIFHGHLTFDFEQKKIQIHLRDWPHILMGLLLSSLGLIFLSMGLYVIGIFSFFVFSSIAVFSASFCRSLFRRFLEEAVTAALSLQKEKP
jgi:hypothetical protein